MTTVSIYDDIDPIKKETGRPVSLYDELDITSNTNDPSSTTNNNTNPSPNVPTVTITSTSTYPQTTATSTNTNTNTSNTNNNTSSSIIKPPLPTSTMLPQIINNTSHIPPANDHIDPSLTGVPLQHLSTYKSHVLYVGGIQWWVTDADIRRTFDQFGTIVDVKIHADKVNGKSKGYGYVEFDTRELEAAVIAKQKLHGHILSDCRISVAFASPDRAKGAEYTNTPVHIPRHKMNHPMTSNPNTNNTNANSMLPKLNVMPTHHHPHNVLAAMNNVSRNTIGAPNNLSNILNNNAITSRSNHANNMSHRATHRPIRSNKNNNNTAAAAAATVSNSSGNTGGNVSGNTTGNNNNGNNATNTSNTIGLLSKFTDQAQLLALLNKTNSDNRSGSRSSVSGSRSRSRSRSRSSKHSRRRRHGGSRKKNRRRGGGGDRDVRNERGRRERERERERDRRGDVMSGDRDGDRERDRERRKHKRRHRHRDRGYDRERHRERRKRRKDDANSKEEVIGDGDGDDKKGVQDGVPITNITELTLMNVDKEKGADEDE